MLERLSTPGTASFSSTFKYALPFIASFVLGRTLSLLYLTTSHHTFTSAAYSGYLLVGPEPQIRQLRLFAVPEVWNVIL